MEHLTRRHFLRGMGVTLALPWLESMPLLGQVDSIVKPGAAKPPVRFGVVYFSNGVEPEHWWARGAGAAMEMGPALHPLKAHSQDLVFVRGLYNEAAAKS